MEVNAVRIEMPEGGNVVIGQAHFIKTVEDLHEVLAAAGRHVRFGIAFSEASGPCLNPRGRDWCHGATWPRTLGHRVAGGDSHAEEPSLEA